MLEVQHLGVIILILDGGGAGNPGGWGFPSGENGTGGLLIIYTQNYNNLGIIKSKGSFGGLFRGYGAGGSSGGGSINIFYKKMDNNYGTLNADGVISNYGGAGGNGTVTIGSIVTGTFEKYEK